ncbi:MAG: glycosyltransferase family A protein [Tepidisphaeraceae bacterium]|jgi:GT2 family glycosyltransferase
MKPRVSIIICTYNNSRSLQATIDAVGRVAVPTDLPAELVVVDNAYMVNAAPKLIGHSGPSNMPLRVLFEPARGKCRALNHAIADANGDDAKGDILLFTDDDVRPPTNWIEGMCRPIADGSADAVAGGVVFPAEYESVMSRPPYSRRRNWFASSESLDPNHPNRMIGANMSFGRHVLSRVAAFDVTLGPGALGFGDETLFAFQLLDQGFRIAPALHVAVEHHFDRSRLRRPAMLAIAARCGQSAAYLAWHWRQETFPISDFTLLRRRAGLWRRRLLHPLDWIGTGIPADWELEVAESIGFQRQYLIESRLPRRYQRRTEPAKLAMAS